MADSDVLYRGYVFTEQFQDFWDEIENFEVYDDDIWVTSPPKCGTTWTQEMVWCIGNNVDLESAKEILSTRFPFFEQCTLSDLLHFEEDVVYLTRSVEFIKNLKRPRYIKTHLPWDLLPKQIRNFEKHPKIIQVIRNPKDACVSLYHHRVLFGIPMGSLEEFCDVYIKGKIIWSPTIKSMISFWNQKDKPNILILRYEEMKENLVKVLYKVAEFLKVSLSKEQVEILKKHLSFEEMKNNEYVNYNDLVLLFNKGVMPNGSFIRKGEVGRYKEELSDDMIKKLDAWIKKETEGTDLSF